MVWRDIDVGARCRDLTPARAWDALRPLLTNPRLMRLDYRNEIGERSPSGKPTDQRHFRAPSWAPWLGALLCGYLVTPLSGRSAQHYLLAGVLLAAH